MLINLSFTNLELTLLVNWIEEKLKRIISWCDSRLISSVSYTLISISQKKEVSHWRWVITLNANQLQYIVDWLKSLWNNEDEFIKKLKSFISY